MEPAQFMLPTIATIALGTALLVPLRDDRRGRRATLRGDEPLRPEFGAIGDVGERFSEAGGEPNVGVLADAFPAVAVAPTAEAAPSPSIDRPSAPPFANASNFEGRAPTDAPETIAAPSVRQKQRTRRAFDRLRRLLTLQRTPTDVGIGTEVASLDAVTSEIETTIERSFSDQVADLLAPSIATIPDPIAKRGDADDAPNDRATNAPAIPDGTGDDDAPKRAIVARLPTAVSRVVPLTRLPLRARAEFVAWPSELDPDRTAISRDERHALLVTLGRTGDLPTRIFERAYAEEDARGRFLSLRALLRSTPSPRTRAIFLDAINTGSDDERAIAIEALALHGAREDIASALNDRVVAIAAAAALAFVASKRRKDYRRELTPHLDAARIETILALLAGIVE